jgi:carboxyl-terminal processing protease
MFRHETRAKTLRVLLIGLGALIVVAATASDAPARRSPFEPLSLFARALAFIELAYVEPVDQEELVHGAIRGLAESLDPHSVYMDPEEYEIFLSDSEGRFAGIGVEVSTKDGWITILAVFEGGPAKRGGLLPGDRFLSIDGEEARDMRIYDAVRMIRGEPGTTVDLALRREGVPDAVEVTLPRAFIELDPVQMEVLDDGIVYLRIEAFQDGTARALRDSLDAAVVKLKRKGGVRGILLDLRDNGGGLLDEAIWVSDEFLASGVIVTTRGRDEREVARYSARRGGTRPKWPVVVLINENTASASEIVAGALQDHERATLVGERSFGKGSVQTIFDLPGGSALKLTISRYFTPSGRSIQALGITPDLHAEQPRTNGEPEPYREEELDGHLAATSNPGRALAKREAPVVSGKVPKKFDEDSQGARGYVVLRGMIR